MQGPLNLEEKELRAIYEQISRKAAQRYRTVREALRFVDADHDGMVERTEVRYFFRAYDLSEKVADRFFDRLDREGSGLISLQTFADFMGPVIERGKPTTPSPSQDLASVSSTREPSREVTPANLVEDFVEPQRQEIGSEFAKELEQIRLKAVQRFQNANDIFKHVDSDKDGYVSRGEMRHLFRAFSLPQDAADQFFERLCEPGRGEASYHELVRQMGPLLDLPGGPAVAGAAKRALGVAPPAAPLRAW